MRDSPTFGDLLWQRLVIEPIECISWVLSCARRDFNSSLLVQISLLNSVRKCVRATSGLFIPCSVLFFEPKTLFTSTMLEAIAVVMAGSSMVVIRV
jgi:hypothetical protein